MVGHSSPQTTQNHADGDFQFVFIWVYLCDLWAKRLDGRTYPI